MTTRRKAVRCPPQSKWHLLASTAEEALARGEGHYMRRDAAGEIIPCKNGHFEPRSSAVQKGKEHGECRACRRGTNERARYRERMADPAKKARVREQQTAWNTDKRARGLLSNQAAQYRTPDWIEETEKAAIRKLYKRAKSKGQDVDHLGPVDHTVEDNLVSGLHVKRNLKPGSRHHNLGKGGKLPDPDTLMWPPRRPWTLADMRRRVREGIMVWSHDVDTSVKPKDRWKEPRVRWDLYHRDPKTGEVTYKGFEPTMLVGNAELLRTLQAFEEADGDISSAARARGLKPMELRDRLVEAANRGLGRMS